MDGMFLHQRGLVPSLVCFLLLCCAGCSVLGRKHDVIPREHGRSGLRHIDGLQSDAYSESEPRTVEEEAPGITDQVIAAVEPPSRIALTLADVRAATLAHNLDLEVELLNPAIAQQEVSIEEGQFDALLGFGANRLHLDTPGVFIPDSQFDSRSYEAEIALPSRTGGSFSLSRPWNKVEDPSPATYESDWRFSFSQPLFRNAGVRINTAPIRIAKYNVLQVDAATRLRVIEELAAADRQYWRLWAARKELEIREQQLELAQEQMENVRTLVAPGGRPELGVRAEYEITRAQAGLARRVEAIIVAKANVRIVEREMKRLINRPDLPLESETSIELLTDPNPVGLELDEDLLAATALENRPEIVIQDYQLSVDGINIDVAHNSRLPLATVDGSSTINGSGTTFGSASDRLYGGRYADYALGLNVTVPIPNQTARASHRQARLLRAQTIARREQLAQRIQQEVYDSVTLFDQNWQRILAARNNVLFATRDLDVERKLFEVGEQNRTTTEVLDAAARLADAQSSEVQAIGAHQISLVDVAFATGTLLGYGQVQWHLNPSCRFTGGFTGGQDDLSVSD